MTSPQPDEITDGYPTEQVDVSTIPNAVPKVEPRTIAGNKSPYTVFGVTYEVLPTDIGYLERGTASFYGTKFHGRMTSNGEPYDMFGMTAAHKTLPIPSYVKVTSLVNQREVVVRINDRGPFHGDRIIDLSWTAARKLGFDQIGTAPVLVEAIPMHPEQLPPTPLRPLADTPSGSSTAASIPIAGAENGQAFLQVAAFSGYDSARAALDKVSALLSVPAVLHTEPGPQGDLMKLRLGPINSEQEMNQLRQQLSVQGYPDSYLVIR